MIYSVDLGECWLGGDNGVTEILEFNKVKLPLVALL